MSNPLHGSEREDKRNDYVQTAVKTTGIPYFTRAFLRNRELRSKPTVHHEALDTDDNVNY